MNHANTLNEQSVRSILAWAAERQSPISASLLTEGRWCILRSQLMQYDPAGHALKILYPFVAEEGRQPEITIGQELGISLRRGHKKCVFVCRVLMRQSDHSDSGQRVDCLILRAPRQMRELQRRVYQRVIIPEDRFVAVRLWQGSLPSQGEPCWPICSGRAANISLGGVLVDIRSEQNPRLGVGELVGVEITHMPSKPPLALEAQYRHCLMTGPERMGLGLQFLGLEHDRPNRTSIAELAGFVRGLRAAGARIDRED